jgi:hypothetical protein
MLVTTNVVPSSPILITLMIVIRSSETYVLTRVTRVTSQKTAFFLTSAALQGLRETQAAHNIISVLRLDSSQILSISSDRFVLQANI